MARVRTLSSIEKDINNAMKELDKRRDKVSEQEKALNDLLAEKREFETKEIMDAIQKSGKTKEELLEFLKG